MIVQILDQVVQLRKIVDGDFRDNNVSTFKCFEITPAYGICRFDIFHGQ